MGEATRTIQIRQLPPIPIIGGPNQGAVGDSITFDGSGSIANIGFIVNYAWDFGDGTTSSGSRVSHVYGQPGRYRVILTTTNSAGLTASADHDIRIYGQPTAVINAPGQGQVGQLITFYGSGSGADIVSFAWSFGDGANGNGPAVTHAYAQPGNFVVTLTVTDRRGLSATAAQAIAIRQASRPPTAVIKAPNQGTAGQPLAFDGSSSTPGSGQIVKYEWSFGDGTTGSGAQVTHAYAMAGDFTVTLTVTGADNLTASATHAIRIETQLAAVINAPATGTAGRPFTWDGSGSTPGGGQIVGYDWDFGDGSTASGATVSHTYANAGSYTATLTVTDSRGRTAKATQTVTIS